MRRRLIIHGAYGLTIAALVAALDVTVRNAPREYHRQLIQKSNDFSDVTWLGVPVWQPLPDLWTLQEALADVRPAWLIECGTYKGGSSYFFAQLFALMNHGRVITVDIKKMHDLSHPRVTYLIGDCASEAIVSRIRAEAAMTTGPIMVVLDSDHSAAHVRRELDAYHRLVTPGSYLHVQDGAIDTIDLFAADRPGPLVAIEAFLAGHPEFEVDEARVNRFLFTHHPKGWLRRRSERP